MTQARRMMNEQQDPKHLKQSAVRRDSDRISHPPSTMRRETIKPRNRLLEAIRIALKLVLPLLVIFGAAGIMNNLVATKPEVNRRPAREQAYAVQVQNVKPETIRPEIILYGTVSASRKVDLRALVGGEVVWVSPDLTEGRVVAKGDDLVRVDPFDYEGAVREAEANLAEARAKLTETRASISSDESALTRLVEQRSFAEADLARAQKLVKSGSLTKQALENRKLVLSQREQSVEARQNNLTVLKARIIQQEANIERLTWRMQQAKRNLADTVLKAPFAGIVQTKNVELGRSVSGNDSLLSLYDPGRMDVRFTLSDAQYGRLIAEGETLEGREIGVNWKLGSTVRSHKAAIERVTPEVNAANGGIEVFARLQPTSDLRSGTFVELVVPDRNYDKAISIPQAAVYSGNIIYLANEGRMEPVTVPVFAYLGENVLVDASSLPANGQVIVTRVAEAGKGLKIVVPGQQNATGQGGIAMKGEGRKGRGEGASGVKQAGRQGKPEGRRANAQAEGAKE